MLVSFSTAAWQGCAHRALMFTCYDMITRHVYGKTQILLENKDLSLNITYSFVLNVWSFDKIASSLQLVSFQNTCHG